MKPSLDFDVTDISALKAYEDGRFVDLIPKANRPLIRKALEAGFKLPGVAVRTEPAVETEPATPGPAAPAVSEDDSVIPDFQVRNAKLAGI